MNLLQLAVEVSLVQRPSTDIEILLYIAARRRVCLSVMTRQNDLWWLGFYSNYITSMISSNSKLLSALSLSLSRSVILTCYSSCYSCSTYLGRPVGLCIQIDTSSWSFSLSAIPPDVASVLFICSNGCRRTSSMAYRWLSAGKR